MNPLRNPGKYKQRYEGNKDNCLKFENGNKRKEKNTNWT